MSSFCAHNGDHVSKVCPSDNRPNRSFIYCGLNAFIGCIDPSLTNIEEYPWQFCAVRNFEFIWQPCHRHICPVSNALPWPRSTNLRPVLTVDSMNLHMHLTSVSKIDSIPQHESEQNNHLNLLLYQKFTSLHAQSDFTVTTFYDEGLCSPTAVVNDITQN